LTVGKLDGKVAVVTGSGRNIGRAIATTLAREGADVVVNARSNQAEVDEVAAEIRALGRKSVAVVADVSVKAQVDSLVGTALDAFGRIDILANVAAIRPHRPFLELTQQDWDRVRGVVLDGAIYCTQAALPSMVENGGGSVLFVVGEGAWAGGSERAHVGASKMALIGLCRGLASEFAPHQIRFNTISPGRIDTARQSPDAALDERHLESIPLGRLGHVDDVASACLFLVGDDASWITGQTLHVNGGAVFH
jgi:3-oxoacyl-[acyl-carrier protein] reductase